MFKPSVSQLIQDLVPDTGNVPDLLMMEGWLGASLTRGWWRLYRTPELDEYDEIPQQDIVHGVPIAPGVVLCDVDFSGGVRIWVRRGADIRHVSLRGGVRGEAELMDGTLEVPWLGLPTKRPIPVAGTRCKPYGSCKSR